MNYDGTKLVYFDGKPQWLMPDGSFVPARRRSDGSLVSGSLYLKNGRTWSAPRLIFGRTDG